MQKKEDNCVVFLSKQKTEYDMRISDWSSDVCSSDLLGVGKQPVAVHRDAVRRAEIQGLLRLGRRLRDPGRADRLEHPADRRHRAARALLVRGRAKQHLVRTRVRLGK